jgi:hypothetical protein
VLVAVPGIPCAPVGPFAVGKKTMLKKSMDEFSTAAYILMLSAGTLVAAVPIGTSA